MSTKNAKSTQTTTGSTKEPTMKTEKKPTPKSTTKPEKKGAKKPAAEPEQPAISDFAAAAAITSVAAIATSDPDAEIEAVHEAAMKAAREAVERGAEAQTCSDAVAAYAAGAIDAEGFKARLEDAVAVASNAAVDAPGEGPALVDAATADDATGANTDANVGTCDRCGRTDVLLRAEGGLTLHDKRDGGACNFAIEPIVAAIASALEEPTAEPDVRDTILARARTMTPAAQQSFLESFDKKDLVLLVERATGAKTSPRLSPKTAVERILAVLKPEQPKAENPARKAASASADATPATNTRGRAAELPPVGTVLNNVDRHGKVRASCTIVEGGVEYAGQKYTSLSAAAIVTSRDLGNSTKQTSGPRFWGLLAGTPRSPKAAKGLDLDVIGRAWDRYRERAEAATKVASAEDKAKLHALLGLHFAALSDLAAVAAA